MKYKYESNYHLLHCRTLDQKYGYVLQLKYGHTGYCEHSFGVLKTKGNKGKVNKIFGQRIVHFLHLKRS